MDHVDEVVGSGPAPAAAASHPNKRITSVGIGSVFVALFCLLIMWDFSAVVFAATRREQALELLTPGMRITQAERTLNSEGFLTLYIDQAPPYLLVSTLSDLPFTARVLHRLFPGSTADEWLREQLSHTTRFFVKANESGEVQFSGDGQVAFTLAPPNDVSPHLLL